MFFKSFCRVFLSCFFLFALNDIKAAQPYQALPFYGHYGDPYQFFNIFFSSPLTPASTDRLVEVQNLITPFLPNQEQNPFRTFADLTHAAGISFGFQIIGTADFTQQNTIASPWNICWHNWKFDTQDNVHATVQMGLFNPNGLGAAQDLPFNRVIPLQVHKHDNQLSPNNAHFIPAAGREIISFFSGASSDGHNALIFTLIINLPLANQVALARQFQDHMHQGGMTTLDCVETLLETLEHITQPADQRTFINAMIFLTLLALVPTSENLRNRLRDNQDLIQAVIATDENPLTYITNYCADLVPANYLEFLGHLITAWEDLLPAQVPQVVPVPAAQPAPVAASTQQPFSNEPGGTPTLTDTQIRAQFGITYDVPIQDESGQDNRCIICQSPDNPETDEGHLCRLLATSTAQVGTIIHTGCLRGSIAINGSDLDPGTNTELPENLLNFFSSAETREEARRARDNENALPQSLGGLFKQFKLLGGLPNDPDVQLLIENFPYSGGEEATYTTQQEIFQMLQQQIGFFNLVVEDYTNAMIQRYIRTHFRQEQQAQLLGGLAALETHLQSIRSADDLSPLLTTQDQVHALLELEQQLRNRETDLETLNGVWKQLPIPLRLLLGGQNLTQPQLSNPTQRAQLLANIQTQIQRPENAAILARQREADRQQAANRREAQLRAAEARRISSDEQRRASILQLAADADALKAIPLTDLVDSAYSTSVNIERTHQQRELQTQRQLQRPEARTRLENRNYPGLTLTAAQERDIRIALQEPSTITTAQERLAREQALDRLTALRDLLDTDDDDDEVTNPCPICYESLNDVVTVTCDNGHQIHRSDFLHLINTICPLCNGLYSDELINSAILPIQEVITNPETERDRALAASGINGPIFNQRNLYFNLCSPDIYSNTTASEITRTYRNLPSAALKERVCATLKQNNPGWVFSPRQFIEREIITGNVTNLPTQERLFESSYYTPNFVPFSSLENAFRLLSHDDLEAIRCLFRSQQARTPEPAPITEEHQPLTSTPPHIQSSEAPELPPSQFNPLLPTVPTQDQDQLSPEQIAAINTEIEIMLTQGISLNTNDDILNMLDILRGSSLDHTIQNHPELENIIRNYTNRN